MTDLPATVLTEEFEAHGCRIIAERAGAESAEVTYVLVHGIGMGRRVFGDLVAQLQESALIAAVDLPGYGDAPEPPRTPTIERMADLIADYIRHLDRGPVVLVGHSMGSQVAAEVAARHPETVSHLVLVAPTVDRHARHPVLQFGRLLADIYDESPKVLYLGAREYLRAGPNLPAKIRAMFRHRPELIYPKVQAPALVIRGGVDRLSPRRWCEEVAAALPDSRMAVVARRGHETLIADAADAAAAIRSFVAETAQT
ncbi:alpha/beta fold hydrolase [Microbacterium sp.]|uniref:alpha/beta fold hydrolase n=1 Tax=Microbacterium sp. TaxID=51671 RepID=UPI003734D092